MDRLAEILKDCIQMEFGIRVETFFSKRKQLHVGFEQPITSYEFVNDILNFLQSIWEHPNNNVFQYELVFPIPSFKRPKYPMFHYIFFIKEITENMLEMFCDSVCDILPSDLLHSFYVRIVQSKGGKIYLRIKKKRGKIHKKLIKKVILHIKGCVETDFNFYSKKDQNLNPKYYIDFGLINFNSGHYFKFSVLSKDCYNENQFVNYF